MRRTRFDDAPCPIARTTDLIGDWWTPLVMREAFTGARRFEQFAEALDTPRATLAQRLERLVAEGLLRREVYQERPRRYEYRLTEKGIAFYHVLAAMWRWGSDCMWPEGESTPLELVDRDTGERIDPVVVDEHTGAPIDVRRLRVRLTR